MDYLKKIPDHRRPAGRRYDLAHVLLFVILSVLSGARSHRQMAIFIKTHFAYLRKSFGLMWWAPPKYGILRIILQDVNREALERAFRDYSAALAAERVPSGKRFLACDGKTLRGSFDQLTDQKTAHLLSVFDTQDKLILAHRDVGEKSNEIPSFQHLVEELGLTGACFTLDAMHCQKKHCAP